VQISSIDEFISDRSWYSSPLRSRSARTVIARRFGWVAFTGHPAGAFEPVEDAGHCGRVQPGAAGDGAGTERAVAVDEVEAVHVDVLEVKARSDLAVEH